MSSRRIALVDCDQFFVQCARIADPDGAGRESLLLVGGSAEGRGVVTSASYETRAYGVRSGMPTSQALRLCPKARTVPVPRSVCADRSRAVRAVLDKFTPVVEPASIDEAYLDLTGTERLYHDEPLRRTAERIRAAVLAEAGIVVSIGCGTNRLVAKLAVSRAKPAGVYVVEPGAEAEFLASHDLGDIPGVGPVLAAELSSYGLKRVADALPLTERKLCAMFGDRRGTWLYRRMRGLDSTRVETQHTARSISRDETFARDINDDAALVRRLRALVVRLAADTRAAGLRTRTITVRIRDADFRTRQASQTVDEAIETDGAILAIARTLLERLRAQRPTPARLLGVAASGLESVDGEQIALFDAEPRSLETERDRRLTRAADQVRARYGHDAITRGDMIDRDV